MKDFLKLWINLLIKKLWILRIIRSLSILSNYFLELNSKGVSKTLFLLFVSLIIVKTKCYYVIAAS